MQRGRRPREAGPGRDKIHSSIPSQKQSDQFLTVLLKSHRVSTAEPQHRTTHTHILLSSRPGLQVEIMERSRPGNKQGKTLPLGLDGEAQKVRTTEYVRSMKLRKTVTSRAQNTAGRP